MLVAAYYAFIVASIPVAAMFQVLFLRTKLPLLLVCSIVWLLPVCYEIWVLNNCTDECSIRAGLGYLFAVEVVAAGSLSLLSWRTYRQRASRP